MIFLPTNPRRSNSLTMPAIVGAAVLLYGCGVGVPAEASRQQSGTTRVAGLSAGEAVSNPAVSTPAEARTSQTGQTGDAFLLGPAGTPQLSILNRMMEAPFSVPYLGTRNWTQSVEINGLRHNLNFRETVGADGQGQFALEAELLAGPVDPELFSLLQSARQGHNYRQRDFRIRDLTLFLHSYSVLLTATDVQVAGLTCVEFEISRGGLAASYTIDVDPRTGLVLRSEERDSAGAVVASMEFESIEYGGDLSNLALADGLLPRVELSITELETGTTLPLGFEHRLPSLPPPAFELQRALDITDPTGRHWLKLEYTDGLESVVFMHRAPGVAPPGIPPGVASGQADVLALGNLIVVSGEVAWTPFIVTGKASEQDLLMMVESALVVD